MIYILLAIVGTTFALDSEPNNSCGTESLAWGSVGEGSIGSSSDTDHYDLGPYHAGSLQVRLENLGNPDEDFAMALYNSTGTTLLAGATESDGIVELSRTVTTPMSYCLEISGSEGSYRLASDFLHNDPTITDVQDSGGNTITSASIGDVIEIHGTNFGTSTRDVSVTFNGARAKVVYHHPLELHVRVPANASNGDIVTRIAGRRSGTYSFSVGVSTAPTTTLAAPTTSVFTAPDGASFYIGRTIVSFDLDADSSDVTTALDAVLAGDSNLTAYAINGEQPAANIAVVDWTMTSTGGSDHQALFSALRAESDIIGVDMEHVLMTETLAKSSDLDLLHNSSGAVGAFHQVGYEEARRLFEHSGLASLADEAMVIVLDTGLARGSAWTSSNYNEFPYASFELRETDGSAWTTTTATKGHFVEVGDQCGPGTAPTWNHGNAVMSVWGAENQHEPDWEDGAARSHTNVNGILGGFQLFGVDDDGDASIDEDYESVERTGVMLNAWGTSGSSSAVPSLSAFLGAMKAVASDSDLDGVPVVLSAGFTQWQYIVNQYKSYGALKDAARDLCAGRIVVVAAGNGQCGADGGDDKNFLAEVLIDECPDTTIVVGGTIAGSDDSDTDEWFFRTHYGSNVNLLAPATAYRVATVVNSNSWTAGRYESRVMGTSFGTPLVGAAVSLSQAIIGDGVISDSLLVSTIINAADDISDAYTATTGSTQRLNLHRTVEWALGQAGASPTAYQAPRLFAVDYSKHKLFSQEVDPSDGTTPSGTSVESATTSDDGCTSPADVELHPLGDVAYVLCAGSGEIAAYTADDLSYIDSVSLTGSVNSYAEMAISPDGILRVATISGGSAIVESFDTWNGSRHRANETIAAHTGVYGAAMSPDGQYFAAGASDGGFTEDYDTLVRLEPNPIDKASSTKTEEAFTSVLYTYGIRDVSYRADGSAVIGGFLGHGASGDVDVTETDFSGTNDATIDYCDDVMSVAMNPTENDELGYIACQDNDEGFHVVDFSGSWSSSYAASSVCRLSSGSATPSYTPTFVDMAPNGQFAILGAQNKNTSYGGYVYTVAHDDVLSNPSLDVTDYDNLATWVYKPRGSAVTPLLSVASPRPGTAQSGIRTIHVLVRDPNVTSLDIYVDGTLECTDTDIQDGISDSCLVDFRSLGSGEVQVKVEATLSNGDTFFVEAPYTAP